jgi:hypothetical protein
MSTLRVNTITDLAGNPFSAGSSGSSGFISGTRLLFYQAAAPTGWTQVTTHNDKALRVVSGSGGGSGGSTVFTSVFASRTPSGTVNNHTLTIGQIPSHTHNVGGFINAGGFNSGYVIGQAQENGIQFDATTTAGSSQPHSHGFTGTAMDFAVQYIDVIICSKD